MLWSLSLIAFTLENQWTQIRRLEYLNLMTLDINSQDLPVYTFLLLKGYVLNSAKQTTYVTNKLDLIYDKELKIQKNKDC